MKIHFELSNFPLKVWRLFFLTFHLFVREFKIFFYPPAKNKSIGNFVLCIAYALLWLFHFPNCSWTNWIVGIDFVDFVLPQENLSWAAVKRKRKRQPQSKTSWTQARCLFDCIQQIQIQKYKMSRRKKAKVIFFLFFLYKLYINYRMHFSL